MLKVVLPDGEIEVLLTNLCDRKIFTLKNQQAVLYEMEN